MSDGGSPGGEEEINRHAERPRGDGVETDGGKPRLDAVLKCLTHRRRRFILYYLQDHEIVTVDDLATAIAASETERPLGEVAVDRRQAIASELVHRHLPKLRDAMLVEYDDRSKTIRYSEPNTLLEQLLQLLAKLEHESHYNE